MTIFSVRTSRISGTITRKWDVQVVDPITGETDFYHGSALSAHEVLKPGIYRGTYEIDTFGTTVDVLLLVAHTYSYLADTDFVPISIQFDL